MHWMRSAWQPGKQGADELVLTWMVLLLNVSVFFIPVIFTISDPSTQAKVAGKLKSWFCGKKNKHVQDLSFQGSVGRPLAGDRPLVLSSPAPLGPVLVPAEATAALTLQTPTDSGGATCSEPASDDGPDVKSTMHVTMGYIQPEPRPAQLPAVLGLSSREEEGGNADLRMPLRGPWRSDQEPPAAEAHGTERPDHVAAADLQTEEGVWMPENLDEAARHGDAHTAGTSPTSTRGVRSDLNPTDEELRVQPWHAI